MDRPDQNGADSDRNKKVSFLTPARLKFDSFDMTGETPSQSSTPKVVLRPSSLAAQTEKLKAQYTEAFKLSSDDTGISVKNGSTDKSEDSQSADNNQLVSKEDESSDASKAAPLAESVSLKCAQQSGSAPEPATFGLFSGNRKDSNSEAGGFVFGQNLHERASNYDLCKNEEPHTSVVSSDLTFESVKKEEPQKEESEQKCNLKRTLSDAAKEYESKKVKTVFEEVSIITGEEGEYNVLQINCKLFFFDNEKKNYHERGRGILRLNDKESDGAIHSRVVMRAQGSLRVILNTKIWSAMSVEHASEKTIRMTALDSDGLKVFLIMSSAKDSEQLFSALRCRIANLKSREESGNKNCNANDSSIDESASLSSTLDISSNDSFPDYSRQCFGNIKADAEAAENANNDFTPSSETKGKGDNSFNSSDVTNS